MLFRLLLSVLVTTCKVCKASCTGPVPTCVSPRCPTGIVPLGFGGVLARPQKPVCFGFRGAFWRGTFGIVGACTTARAASASRGARWGRNATNSQSTSTRQKQHLQQSQEQQAKHAITKSNRKPRLSLSVEAPFSVLGPKSCCLGGHFRKPFLGRAFFRAQNRTRVPPLHLA